MIAALLRLFALRPLLSLAIMGIPVLMLIAIGLFAVVALKVFVFVILPGAVVIWLVRKAYRSARARESYGSSQSV